MDRFPRKAAQAKVLDGIVGIDIALYLETDLNKLADRIASRRVCSVCGDTTSVQDSPDGKCHKCGGALIIRDDDKREVVENRLKVYNDKTAPLIGYYKAKGVLKTIDGMQSIEAVTASIEEALK